MNKFSEKKTNEIKEAFNFVGDCDLDEKVEILNALREDLAKYSPFSSEPVDFVKWVKVENVTANDYNPNKVAPPEMQLLEISIDHDGYTQPIVTFLKDDKHEIVDGFHRSRVGKESKKISQRIHGYLPIVQIRSEKSDKNNRVASTIRHNRARGKHQIDAMSEIVIDLKNRNWTNTRIARELGMEEDEILRLCQISGLESLFLDKDFSRSWEASDQVDDFEVLTDDVEESIINSTRTSNTNDKDRFFHTYEKWECLKAGLYATHVDGLSSSEAEEGFAQLFRDGKFEEALKEVTKKWKYSCEHYLTNKAMNRIAWLGQACVCYSTGIPSRFSGGWSLLTEDEKNKANELALVSLNAWLKRYGLNEIEMTEALSEGRQVEIY